MWLASVGETITTSITTTNRQQEAQLQQQGLQETNQKIPFPDTCTNHFIESVIKM